MSNELLRYQGDYLAIIERDGWEYASRTNARGVAVIIAVTDEDQLVLVEQNRIPVQRRVLELPAGLVGDGDDPEEAMLTGASRELEEETGYRAKSLTPVLRCPSTAGLSDEMITFFLAEGLEKTGPGGGDDTEDIEVHLVDIQAASAWLADRNANGIYLDPKIYTALYWLGEKER